MAKERKDEILGAVGSDTEVVPRYDIVDKDGNVLQTDVKLVLKNEVIQEGMVVDKTAMDECLAASGTTAGSATAYTLAQPGFVLFDGALIRFKLHAASGATPTINVNATGAKKLMQTKYKNMRAGVAAGTWLTAVYSTTLGFFLLQGSENANTLKYGNEKGQISSFELMLCGRNNPHYSRKF